MHFVEHIFERGQGAAARVVRVAQLALGLERWVAARRVVDTSSGGSPRVGSSSAGSPGFLFSGGGLLELLVSPMSLW